MTQPHKQQPIHVGDVVLLDGIRAECVLAHPSGQIGISIDLEGRLNSLRIRDTHRYLVSASGAAELIAAIIVAANVAAARGAELEFTGGTDFSRELFAAIAVERRRLGLVR